MYNPTTTTFKRISIFYYLLLLTVFFISLEISFVIQTNGFELSDVRLITHAITIPTTIIPGIVFFVLAQLALHLAFCMVITLITIAIANLLHLTATRTLYLGVGIWFIALLTLLVANQCYFPNSKFADLTALFLPSHRWAKLTLIILLMICTNLLILAVVSCLDRLRRRQQQWLFVLTGIVAIVSLLLSHPWHHHHPHPLMDKHADKPNVIVIGFDSLRPDFLSFFGNETMTPWFDHFLSEATVFSETVTPLARTFPSWSSILTGAYPRQNGVRFNLAQQQHLDLSHSLPALLHAHGYDTVFATDETRFSNIDKNFGYDQIITPPMGLNDFILGTFNDFPLSNLIVNTWLGRWLFPHSYANRPVFVTYEPDSFIHLLTPALQQNRQRPLFLTVHFCLTHHPYIWAGLSAKHYGVRERYEASVRRVDKQIQTFFALLKRYHYLDHAIVVLLSDHGEALELPGDRVTEAENFIKSPHEEAVPKFYPPSAEHEHVNQSAGHGTDVLGISQYHTLLAFKYYGKNWQKPSINTGVVSLLDVKPTILEILGIKDLNPSPPYAGKSLYAVLRGERTGALTHQHIFLESDFSPAAIRTVYPEMRQVMLEGLDIFQVDPVTTRLTVKESMGMMIIHSKQYADIYEDWILALYPQDQAVRMPILVNLRTGLWTNDLSSSFARHSPAAKMLIALKLFYGEELAQY